MLTRTRRLCPVWSFLAALSATVPGTALAQRMTCTMAACESGFTVALKPAEPLPPGTYRIDAVMDLRTVWCTIDLPRREHSMPAMCRAMPRVGRADFALREEAGSFTIGGWTPADVTLVLSRDGVELLRKQFQPKYTPHHPNGPACDDQPCLTFYGWLEVPTKEEPPSSTESGAQ